MAALQFDTEFWKIFEPLASIQGPVFDDAIKLRHYTNNYFAQRFKDVPRSSKLTTTKYEIESVDGTKIEVTRFLPLALKDSTAPQPATVYIHGGGMILGSVDSFRAVIEAYVDNTGVQFFAVSYRLAPEHPFPAAVEDAYASIKWVQANAKDLNVDPTRVALMGTSAGGGIAAGTALMARDKGLDYQLARLILIYPMLDDRTNIEPENPLHKCVVWSANENELGWKSYLGGRSREQRRDDVSIYAAPGRAETLEGLPPTYIDVGGLDLFVNEITAFVAKLAKANNHVEFHLYPGITHGFEGIAPKIRVVKEATLNRVRVLTSF